MSKWLAEKGVEGKLVEQLDVVDISLITFPARYRIKFEIFDKYLLQVDCHFVVSKWSGLLPTFPDRQLRDVIQSNHVDAGPKSRN